MQRVVHKHYLPIAREEFWSHYDLLATDEERPLATGFVVAVFEVARSKLDLMSHFILHLM